MTNPLDIPLPPIITGLAGAREALSKLWGREVHRQAVVRYLNRARDPLRTPGPKYAPLRWARRPFVLWAIRNGTDWRRHRRAYATATP